MVCERELHATFYCIFESHSAVRDSKARFYTWFDGTKASIIVFTILKSHSANMLKNNFVL